MASLPHWLAHYEPEHRGGRLVWVLVVLGHRFERRATAPDWRLVCHRAAAVAMILIIAFAAMRRYL